MTLPNSALFNLEVKVACDVAKCRKQRQKYRKHFSLPKDGNGPCAHQSGVLRDFQLQRHLADVGRNERALFQSADFDQVA